MQGPGATVAGHEQGGSVVPVCQLDDGDAAMGFSVASTALLAISDARSAQERSHAPRILFRLKAPSERGQDSEDTMWEDYLDLAIPQFAQIHGATSSTLSGLWLRALPTSCNDAARAAWRIPSPSGIPSLRELAHADPSFLECMAQVALSVAAPQGMAPMQPLRNAIYRPAAQSSSLVPGQPFINIYLLCCMLA